MHWAMTLEQHCRKQELIIYGNNHSTWERHFLAIKKYSEEIMLKKKSLYTIGQNKGLFYSLKWIFQETLNLNFGLVIGFAFLVKDLSVDYLIISNLIHDSFLKKLSIFKLKILNLCFITKRLGGREGYFKDYNTGLGENVGHYCSFIFLIELI